MLLRLQNAVTSMNALVRQQERVANNLANANTTGYKRSSIVFHDLLYQTVQTSGQEKESGETPPASLQIGPGSARSPPAPACRRPASGSGPNDPDTAL